MIEIEQIEGLDNIPPRVKKPPIPQSVNPNLPKLYFSLMSIGAKNSGKSYSIVKLLKNFEQYPIKNEKGETCVQRIILFCPTAASSANPIYTSLKYLAEEDIFLEYDDAILLGLLEEIDQIKQEIKERDEYKKAYSNFVNKNIKYLKREEMELLYENEFASPDELPKLKYEIMPIYFFILDDLIGDGKAFKAGNNAMSNLCIKHRHYGINLLYASQYSKGIPPMIRSNIDIYCLFKFANVNSVVEKIYPEVSGLLKEEDFIEMYEEATKDPHNCLVVDNHPLQDKQKRFKINYDKIIKIKSPNIVNNE